MAEWTNYYAARQPVRIVRRRRGRVEFAVCELGDDGQQWWCGDLEAKREWKDLTKWHILMVIGVLLRGGSNRDRSFSQLWANYDNVGDDVVKRYCSNAHFEMVLKFIVCSDYRNLQTTTDGKATKLCKVQPILDMLQEKFRNLYDMSQRGCIDEATVLCKSRYCSCKNGTRRSLSASTSKCTASAVPRLPTCAHLKCTEAKALAHSRT